MVASMSGATASLLPWLLIELHTSSTTAKTRTRCLLVTLATPADAATVSTCSRGRIATICWTLAGKAGCITVTPKGYANTLIEQREETGMDPGRIRSVSLVERTIHLAFTRKGLLAGSASVPLN